MEILYFKVLDSTQTYLVEKIKNKTIKAPISVICEEQILGIGSRDNRWKGEKGNFFSSLAISIDDLPDDLPLATASIYFSYIMKKLLYNIDKRIWLKWPNDFYVNESKVGGTITHKVDNTLVCGIGINLKDVQNEYQSINTNIKPKVLLKHYLEAVQKFPTWKQIFSQYEVEFELSKRFSVHIENKKVSLQNAILCKDGSLMIDNKKVYSLR